MNKFDLLIVLLQAYQNACKDYHYFCNSYAKHLLADAVNDDDLYDIIDSIKENLYIAHGQEPLKGKVYAEAVAKATPLVKDSDAANLIQLEKFASRISELVDLTKLDDRRANVIFDSVAEKMAHACTLLNIEIRSIGVTEEFQDINEELDNLIAEAEEVIKVARDHKANTEKPIDRKEAKITPIDHNLVAKTVRDYEEQNVLVAEESTLDRVGRKLGI